MLLAALDHASRGGDHGPRFFFPLFLLLLIGFLVGGVIRRKRGGGSIGRHRHGYGSPMATLQERFAQGEINQAEFDHRRAVLNGDDVIPPAPAAPARVATEPPAPPAPPASEPVDSLIDSDEAKADSVEESE